ncbi:MAG: hypothetical protein COV35_05345 [Alphaproteobacteria bacterium CG11_big_fil_rev_8_21_14_0_20_39_49]|nr:MAG: hypothetical protein COV35_05345 [Alphaproteobacteria bacterium CG11_big_fil_rev_8_21_14_0_20_39_49]
MNHNLKFFTYIILVCASLLPLKANSLTQPDYQEKSNDKKVLAGLVIRHGEIIDALQPIYRPINYDGTLGEPYKGKQYGGNGGNRTEIYNDDYVMVGVIYKQGYWMGSKRLASFSPIMQKWENGRPTGDMIKVGRLRLS